LLDRSIESIDVFAACSLLLLQTTPNFQTNSILILAVSAVILQKSISLQLLVTPFACAGWAINGGVVVRREQ